MTFFKHGKLARLQKQPSRSKKARGRIQLRLETLEDRTVPTTFTWQGATGDSWTDGTKWDQQTAPTMGSDVIINNGTTPTYNTTVEINTLTLSATSGLSLTGGTLTTDAASTLNGTVTLSGATLAAKGAETLAGTTSWTTGEISSSDAGSWTNSGTLTISGSSTPVLIGTLNNNGTITQTGGDLTFEVAVLNNSGTYNIQENGQVMNIFAGNSSNNAFHNTSTGVFEKTALNGPANIASTLGTVPFNNDAGGIVSVTVPGTLGLSGGGKDTGGNFNFQNGGNVDLNGGSAATTTLTGTYTGSGTGTVSLTSGTLGVGTGGASLNFPSGLFQWTTGTINTGANTLTNAATGFMTFNGTGDLVLIGTFNNAGTITQTTPGASFNPRLDFEIAVLNNSGTYDVQENGQVMNFFAGNASQNAFNNPAGGTFQKSGPAMAGTTTNGNVPFSNVGTVNAKSGTLSLASVAQDNGGTSTLTAGTWDVFTSSTLTFSSGDNLTTNNGNITLDGSGSVFTNITNLATNNGTFTLKDGRSFTTVGAFTNAGGLTVDATGGADTFTASRAYLQTAGTTTLVAGAAPWLPSSTRVTSLEARSRGRVTSPPTPVSPIPQRWHRGRLPRPAPSPSPAT
jgi:hypothetical protein